MIFLGGKILASLAIAYGDFKERKIIVLVLIALFLINSFDSYFKLGSQNFIMVTGINIFVVSFIFSLTYVYLKKVKKISNPAQTHLGIGDWLFFIAITPMFLPEVFIYVFLFMNVIALLFSIIMMLITKDRYEIPYAGISALIFAMISIIQYLSPLQILSLN